MSAESEAGAGSLFDAAGLRSIVGIDPGAKGAYAVLWVAPGFDRPELEMTGRAATTGPAGVSFARDVICGGLVVWEQQRASPQMGTASAFHLGERQGWLAGVLSAAGRSRDPSAMPEVVRVEPSVWRGAYGLSGGAAGKARGMALAAELIGANLETHDEADAVLLAWWGWKNILLPRLAAGTVDTPESRW